MRVLVSLAVLASLPMMSACNRSGSDTAALEDKHGNKRDVTEEWLVGRWAEEDDRDCRRSREFQRGGDLMDEGEARDWRLREGRGDETTLEIDRDEYRAERYGSTLVLVDDRDRVTEYRRCEGSSAASGSTSGNSAAPVAPPVAAAPAAPTADPALTAELATGVTEIKAALPIVNGPMTMTDAYSSGAQLTMVGNVSVDLSAPQWSAIETNVRQNNCTGPFGPYIRRGAIITATITDSAGEVRSITTNSCP